MKKLTLKDIALAVNKSISTVSKALSDSHEVNEETKKLIQSYAKAHNFQSNRLAQSLRTGKSQVIGVIISTISNSFFSQILEGIDEYLVHTDYSLVIMQSKEHAETERKCIETLYARGVDGIIISPVGYAPNIELLRNLHENGCPIVVIDRINNILNTDKIGVKNFEGAYLAVQHLIEQGRSKIVHITGKNLGVVSERLDGYKRCLEDHNITLERKYILQFDLQDTTSLENEIQKSLTKLFKSSPRPDAIFAATDVLTNKLTGILNEMEVKIPQEIALIGFSNSAYSKGFSPPLSCIYQPAKEMGQLGAQKLIEILNLHTKDIQPNYERIELDPLLIVRKSTTL